MTDHSSYLLRTWPQIRDFRCRYAGYIARQADAYVSWISRMPLREWMDYLQGVPVANVPVVIGTICLYTCRYAQGMQHTTYTQLCNVPVTDSIIENNDRT